MIDGQYDFPHTVKMGTQEAMVTLWMLTPDILK
jgi:hypothetical protein